MFLWLSLLYLSAVIYRYLGVEKVTYVWLWKSCCVARSERVNGWRLNPNITQALIPPIGLVLTWLDLFYSMWFLLGQMNGYGWPIYIAVKTSANLTNWDGLSLLYYHLVLLTLDHSGSSWGIWNLKTTTFIYMYFSLVSNIFCYILILIFLSMVLYYQNQVFRQENLR